MCVGLLQTMDVARGENQQFYLNNNVNKQNVEGNVNKET